MILLNIAKATATALAREPLTSGMSAAVEVGFGFSPDWLGLSKTAVFTNGRTTVDVLESQWSAQGTVAIPHEVLSEAGRRVLVGIYGTDGERVVLPTVWAELGVVLPGADPSGDESTDPSLPVWAQLHDGVEAAQKRANVSIRYDTAQEMDASDRVRAALNAGSIPVSHNLQWWDAEHATDIQWFVDQARYLGDNPARAGFLIAGRVSYMPVGYGDATVVIRMEFDHMEYVPASMLLHLDDGRVYRLNRLPGSTAETPDDCGTLLNVTTVNGSTGAVKTTVVVTFSQQDDGTLKASHTAGEIAALADAGYSVSIAADGILVPLFAASPDAAVFAETAMVRTNGLDVIAIHAVVAQSGGIDVSQTVGSAPVAGRLVVNVTENASGALTCDKTYETVEAAVNRGDAVVLKLTSAKRENKTYSFSCAGDGYLSFTAAIEVYDDDGDGVPEGIYSPGGVLLYNNNTVYVDAEDDLPFSGMTAKNPHALTFTGAVEAVYDGSEAVRVEIPAGGGGAVNVDPTLSVEGMAADAKACGDGLNEVRAALAAYIDDVNTLLGGG